MRSQPLGVCKTLLIIKLQLITSYNLLKLSGYPSRRELLDLSKKLWCSVGERFFRNAAKEMEKKSHLVENHCTRSWQDPPQAENDSRVRERQKKRRKKARRTLHAEMKWH